MALPKRMARINRLALNPLVRRFGGHVPPFALVDHVGRRSGRHYRSPIMAFRSPDGFVIALTYGVETDWVRNVLAAGSATLEYRGQRIPVDDPRLTPGDEIRSLLLAPVRSILRLIDVDQFLAVRVRAYAGRRPPALDALTHEPRTEPQSGDDVCVAESALEPMRCR